MVTFAAPAESSNSSRLLARVRSSRMLLACSGSCGRVVVPFQAQPTMYGRRRLPASNATTTWLPTSGRIARPWLSSAYGVHSVAHARTSRSPSEPRNGNRTSIRPRLSVSTRSVTIAG